MLPPLETWARVASADTYRDRRSKGSGLGVRRLRRTEDSVPVQRRNSAFASGQVLPDLLIFFKKSQKPRFTYEISQLLKVDE